MAKITFITSGFGISGGTKAIFEFANHLTEMGHQVFVVASKTPMAWEKKWFNPFNISTRILRIFRKSRACAEPDWFDLKAKIVRVPSLTGKHIPDADIVVATWWETAFFVAKYSGRKGKKFYNLSSSSKCLDQDVKTYESS